MPDDPPGQRIDDGGGDHDRLALTVLHEVKVGMAIEAAALLADRRASQRAGRLDVAQLASRRVDALMKMASLELDAVKLGESTIDIGGSTMLAVEKLFVAIVDAVAAETLPTEVAGRLREMFSAELRKWRIKLDEI